MRLPVRRPARNDVLVPVVGQLSLAGTIRPNNEDVPLLTPCHVSQPLAVTGEGSG